MSKTLQLGVSDYEQVYAKKKTRRQIFLDEMEATLHWDDFYALIHPVYRQPSSKRDRPLFPLDVMQAPLMDQRAHHALMVGWAAG